MTDHDVRTQELFNQTILSWDEAEVQALREEGLTTEEIADQLQMAEATVEEFTQRVRNKKQRARNTLDHLESVTLE